MENLEKMIIGAVLVGSLSGCGLFWGRETPAMGRQQKIGYSGDCNNPECPGHGGSNDRCLKSFKDLLRYPFR